LSNNCMMRLNSKNSVFLVSEEINHTIYELVVYAAKVILKL